MKISQLALLTGASVHALRHYERLGLITPTRTNSGYRDYTDAMRREVVFIVMSRAVGVSLATIAELLPAYRSKRLTHPQIVETLRQRITELDIQVQQLTDQKLKVLSHIDWHLEQNKENQQNPPRPAWPKGVSRKYTSAQDQLQPPQPPIIKRKKP
jgi:MerR family transcriptional regulator, copper efflux regulator